MDPSYDHSVADSQKQSGPSNETASSFESTAINILDLPLSDEHITEEQIERTFIGRMEDHLNNPDQTEDCISLDESYNNKDPLRMINLNFNDMYVKSNSPMASNCNSDVEVDRSNSFIEEDDFPLSPSSRFLKKNRKQNVFSTVTGVPPPPSDKLWYSYSDSRSESANMQEFTKRSACAGATSHYSGSSEMSISDDELPNHVHHKYENTSAIMSDESSDSHINYSAKRRTNRLSNEVILHSTRKYKKFTYDDIEKSLSQYYDKSSKNFTETDLLITYLSGMRTIYSISKNITQLKSYSVSMATISITICLAVIAPLIKDMSWGYYLISSGNAFLSVLIFLSRYLKFDSNSAQYAFMAKQFNKLEVRVEFENTIENPSSRKMHEIESTIMEMNEYIQELIPEEAVQLFPLIYRTNIMQFIKKTELYRKNLIIRFRDIKNEIHYILYRWNSNGEAVDNIDTNYQSKTPQQEREKNRILYLMNIKEKTKKELMQYKNIYIQIDELFKQEIRYAETHQSCFGCSSAFKPNYDVSKFNPVVRDYLKLVTPD